MRRFVMAVAWIVLAAAVSGCQGGGGGAPSFAAGTDKVKVAASFYPMGEFARKVGGERVDVIELVPAGVEPHDWEPTAAHLTTLNAAQLFVYNGGGFEHWVDKTLQSLDNKQLVAVEASRGLPLVQGAGEDGKEQGADPHVWLDPQAAIHEVEAIRDGLIQVDGADRVLFEKNATAYIAELNRLDDEYRRQLSGCTQKRFFTSHAAFFYLAQRYGLEQHAIMGLSPDAEPSPKDLARVVDQARADGVKFIFFETLVSDKVARLVAQEVGARPMVLNPIEGLTESDQKAGKDYLAVMRENLVNLKTALECGN